MRRTRLALGLAAATLVAAPAAAQSSCDAANVCTARMTKAELLSTAEKLVLDRQFAAAQPLIAALAQVPEYAMQRRFLAGYVAVETGDVDGAINDFRAVLQDHPEQTRVRLELARALMLKGNESAAEHHLRLAAHDRTLPADIAATIRSTRGVIRDRRIWHFNLDVGFAPDTNINNATGAETVDVVFGNATVPLSLDSQARARSGVGQTGGFSGGVRLRLGQKFALLVDGDGQFSNYKGTQADDCTGQLAIGPEYKLSDATSVSMQAVASQRWFGGDVATRQWGLKAAVQSYLSAGQRVGLQIDARSTSSGFDTAYDGWQMGAYATYERVIGRSLIASASVFGRREALDSKVYSNTEYGVNLGIGGELPLGLNAGISGGISKADFDASMPIFSADARHDLRLNGRAYVGSRALRVLGFSPSVTYTYTGNASSYDYFKTDRHRVRFNLARYF